MGEIRKGECISSPGDCNTKWSGNKCKRYVSLPMGVIKKGECISSPGDCHTGRSGNKFKVPSSCPDGFYGELCNYNCYCKNKAACDKNTGVCQNGDCATGWINIDTVDSDCQQDGTPKIRRFLNHKVNPGEVYTTQFYCEVSGNPVSNSGDLKIWKSGTSDYLTLTNTGSSKYLVFVNSTSVNVDIRDVYNCGYPSNGPKESINIQYYVLPTFRVNNGPSVNDFRSDQITVTWNEWTTDDIGDGPVEFYKVYYRMSDQNDWIPASTLISDTSQTNYKSNITGLQWSTEYEITVTVKRPGPLGEGSKDATITATTLCAIPQKPIIENVSSPELKQLEVHVQVPGVNDIKCKQDGVNGYVQYIELLYRKEGTQDEYEVQREDYKRSVTDTEVITITDDSLLPYTEYEVIALLSNADAKSSWSEAVTCRTSED
uniref:Tyrosine-protein kinase receptor Tie-1-like n=1 Tax=Saccoglossus kowalevskii TaxID=10224 RepID=A0ABM0MWU3_SACKO